MEKESVGLEKKDAINQARWRVGVKEIAAGVIPATSIYGYTDQNDVKPDQNWIDLLHLLLLLAIISFQIMELHALDLMISKKQKSNNNNCSPCCCTRSSCYETSGLSYLYIV